MAKIYSEKKFFAQVEGEQMCFYCWATDTRNGFCHHVQSGHLDANGRFFLRNTRVSYLNRTWESFQFETALKCHFDKFPKATREELRKQVCNA